MIVLSPVTSFFQKVVNPVPLRRLCTLDVSQPGKGSISNGLSAPIHLLSFSMQHLRGIPVASGRLQLVNPYSEYIWIFMDSAIFTRGACTKKESIKSHICKMGCKIIPRSTK